VKGSGSLVISYKGSELLAVPAAHFNHIFASEVNRLCSDLATRPDVIAVELGHSSVAAAKDWLIELGVYSGYRKDFPVMLGLMKRNHVIRPSLRDKVFNLQKETGRDLSELSPEVLYRELGITGFSLLCLSPVDSIIEAIRCGLELNIPVYGVDLENIPDSKYKPVFIQDPKLARTDMVSYIAQNARFAEEQRDEEIDHRREIAMTARIKSLLQNYRRVLFTGGMAHWTSLKNLLEDESIKPSMPCDSPAVQLSKFKRVVVHPVIAIEHMDIFPAIAREYEKLRTPVNSQRCHSGEMAINPESIFQSSMMKACREYFYGKNHNDHDRKIGQNLMRFEDFQAYVRNLCILKQRIVPDFFMITKASQEIMSKDFTQVLVNVFMRFPWASPEAFNDCALLVPPSDDENDSGLTVLYSNDFMKKEYFYMRSQIPTNPSMTTKIPFTWQEMKKLQKRPFFDCSLHTWLPWDRLVTSLSKRALDNINGKYRARKTVEFEGSILEGIDMKSTTRAYSRGKDQIYVRDISDEKIRLTNPMQGYPVVWILHPVKHDSSEWNVLYEPCSYMEKYIRDQEYFKKIAIQQGSHMVAVIGYGKTSYKDSPGISRQIKCDRFQGFVSYQPICWTNKQYARWAESTNYRRNPFCNDGSLSKGYPSDLSKYYKNTLGVEIWQFDWETILLLFAIPFSKDVLTVVVPEDYQIKQVVHEKAKKFGVEICTVTLRLFSKEEIERISCCYLVPAITIDPECIYSREIEQAIGEKQTDNRHLVPQQVLDFGNGIF
jgi:hypothetical protein